MPLLVVATLIIIILATNNSTIKNQAVILLLCCLFSTRSMEIADTENYLDIFNYNLDDSLMQYEIGFRYLNYIFHDILGMSFSGYLFLLSFILLEIWYFCTTRLLPKAHYGLLFLMYIVYYGYYYDGVVIRNALAIMICYIGILVLYKKGKLRYLLYVAIVLLAFTMHVASIVFLIVPFLFRSFSKKFLYIWVVANFLLIIFSSAGFVQGILGRITLYNQFEQLGHYTDSDYINTKGLSVFFILNFLLSTVAVYYRGKVAIDRQEVYNFFLNIFLAGVSFDCMTWTLSTASRIGGQFICFSFIPIYLLCYESSLFKKRTGQTVLIILAAIEFFALIHYFPDFLLY